MSWKFTTQCPSCKKEHVFCFPGDTMPSTSDPHCFICPVTKKKARLEPNLPVATNVKTCPTGSVPIAECK
jgi:hypothetical protein